MVSNPLPASTQNFSTAEGHWEVSHEGHVTTTYPSLFIKPFQYANPFSKPIPSIIPSDQTRSSSSFPKGSDSAEPTMPAILPSRWFLFALLLKISMKSGTMSTPVICPAVFCARTIVWPPVPQPKSAMREFSFRFSTKLNARSVISGLPGPCRSRLLWVSINRSNIVISLISLFFIFAP